MTRSEDIARWLSDSRTLVESRSYRQALVSLHKLLFWTKDRPSIQIDAALLMSIVCDAIGQHFFASEYVRYAKTLTDSENSNAPANYLSAIEHTAGRMTNLELADETSRELEYANVKMWHDLGIPMFRGIEHLRLINSHLVTQGEPYLSNMSWSCELPLAKQDKDGKPIPVESLLTAFDLNLGSHVLYRFERTVQYLSQAGTNEAAPIVAHGTTEHLGITLRVPSEHMEGVAQTGRTILAHGLPARECPGSPDGNDPREFEDAAMREAQEGANLFALAFFREAASLHEDRNDIVACLLAHLNAALCLRRLGQNEAAHSTLINIYMRAGAVGAEEIRHMAQEQLGSIRPSDPISPMPQAPMSDLHSSFILDRSSGKILGGVYAEEAEAEAQAMELLNAAWREEFPEDASPFKQLAAEMSFDWEDPSFDDEAERLGVLVQLTPIEGTTRLGNMNKVSPAVGVTPEACADEFIVRVGRSILVLHKRIKGSFSSATGTSISTGNVSTRGHIYDYETMQAPRLGDAGDLTQWQVVDLINMYQLIDEFMTKVGRRDLLLAGMDKAYKVYTGRDRSSSEFEESVRELISGSSGGHRRHQLFSKLGSLTWRHARW